MKDNLHKLWDKIRIYDGAEALTAALFSLLVSGGIGWLLKDFLYGKIPVYEELVAGGSIWDGYNKQGDMTLFYLLYLLIPFFFCFFLWLRHTLFKTEKIKSEKTEEKEKKGTAEKEKTVKSAAGKGEVLLQGIAAALFSIQAVRALESAAEAMMPGHREILNLLADVAAVCVVVFVCAVWYLQKCKKTDENSVSYVLMIAQLFLPFCFLGYYQFYYQFESEEGLIQLFYSAKWKWFCILLFVGFLAYQIRNVWKKKKGIYLSSLVMIAVGLVAGTPEGILSVDFFHNGEMSFPMQQLLSYGKLPYFDLDPIHGFCDYFYSLMNLVFFDGSYFSQSAASMAAGMVMAAFLAFVMGKCIKNSYAAFLLIYFTMPYFVQKAGVRYLLFFAAFFILFCAPVRKDSKKFLWWWILLCMVGIAWNVSIGSSMAVAFLPEVLYRAVHDIWPELKQWKAWKKKDKQNFLLAYGVLIIGGICYLPWFLQILRFLRENAGTTLYVNGTPVFGDSFSLVQTFAFLIPYVITLIYACCGSKKGKMALLSMFSCLLVISNYACVRYDEGARLAVLAVFFMVLYLGSLLLDSDVRVDKKLQWSLVVLCIGMIGYLTYDYLPDFGQTMTAEEVSAYEEIEIMGEETEDPIVYVSGDSVGMPALGTGFIQGTTLNSLKNIMTVLEAEQVGDSYLDLTNKISHYVIFDKESVLPFTSAYNVSNRKMQEKAIEIVQRERPHLILIAPLIQFDLAPVSLRSMEFYTELMDMGYQPYVYEDVIYLLDGDAKLEQAADGRRSLGLAYHKEYLGMLPFIWGESLENSPETMGLEKADAVLTTEDKETEDVVIRVEKGKSDIDYIELIIQQENPKNDEMKITFSSDADMETHNFAFLTGKGTQKITHYLIPLASSPFWQYSQKEELTLEGVSKEEVVDIIPYKLRTME